MSQAHDVPTAGSTLGCLQACRSDGLGEPQLDEFCSWHLLIFDRTMSEASTDTTWFKLH